jgi:hypothetical protein
MKHLAALRALAPDLLRARSVSDLVEHHFGNLHLRLANPGDTTVIEFNLRRENGSH